MTWFMRDQLVLEQALPQTAMGISRFTLDARIAERARVAGAQIRDGSSFNGQQGAGTVWATGKALNRQSDWIGLSAHFENLDVTGLEMHCGPIGYLGMSSIEGGRVNVTGLFRKDALLKGRGIDLLFAYLEANGCSSLQARLREAAWVEGSFVAIAGFEFGAQAGDGFSIGDRSLLIPPFAGNGMSMALEAAEHASQVLLAYAREDLSWEAACQRQDAFQQGFFGTRMAVAARMHPLLLSSFGLRVLTLLSTLGMLPTQRLFNSLR